MSDINKPNQRTMTNPGTDLNGARKAAINLLGAAEITRQRASEYIQEAYKIGETSHYQQHESEDEPVQKTEQHKNPDALEVKAMPEQNPQRPGSVSDLKLKAQLYAKKGRYLSTGMTKKVRHDSSAMINKLKEDIHSQRADQTDMQSTTDDTPDTDTGDNESRSTGSLTLTLSDLRTATSALSTELNSAMETFARNSEKKGREVDYRLRKRVMRFLKRLKRSLPAALEQVGLATKNDMIEINRKLAALGDMATMLRPSEDSSIKNILERRKNDRRHKHLPVNYEKRIEKRRSEYAI